MMKPLRLAGIGCGGRTRTYLELAAKMPQFYEVTAAADPIPERVGMVRSFSNNPGFQAFASDKELLARPRLADVLIIGTQDQYHVEPCLAAMEKGYDILLEKPVAPNPEDVLAIEKRATELGRRVLVCHVLRYTPFYSKVHEIVTSGVLGEIITMNASEGVGAWHQAHSFVRGHWAVTEKSTPMILAKSCHDMDIISWLMDRPCRVISSRGSLSFFNAANAPAGAPARCTDGCPVSGKCIYDAHHYLGRHRNWVTYVHPNPAATDDEVMEWLRHSAWGRCVYHCDNTAVDHQVLAMEFEGGATATFTMTAFDEGRNIEVMGTDGVLRGGHFLKQTTGSDILVKNHATGDETTWRLSAEAGGYDGHGGGDAGLMRALYHEMNSSEPAAMRSSIQRSVQSHLMAFAAEHSRVSGSIAQLDSFQKW